MKLAIFGGSGKTGRLLVQQTLERGDSVSMLARQPEGLASRPGLTIIPGSVGEADKVRQTIAGSEAVLSVLGPTGAPGEYAVSQGIDNIISAMQSEGVRRLVISIGAGVRDPRDRPTLAHALFGGLVKLAAPAVYAEMKAVDERVRASNVDWTIVRVPRLTDGAATGHIRQGYVGGQVGVSLTRSDLAAFMLRQAGDRQLLRLAPAISN